MGRQVGEFGFLLLRPQGTGKGVLPMVRVEL